MIWLGGHSDNEKIVDWIHGRRHGDNWVCHHPNNDRTTFKGNKLKIRIVGHTYHWRLTGLKKHSKTIYYGRLHFNWKKSNKGSKLVKIKIQNKQKFDIIQKHFFNLRGNYTGNENYGAMIFKR